MFVKRLPSTITALTLVALLLLPGLTRASASSPTSSQSLVAAVGTIVDAPEISICQQGATHLLVSPSGRVVTYQLVSRTVDLSQYEGQQVLVIGTASESIEGCPPLLTVIRVVPLPPGSA